MGALTGKSAKVKYTSASFSTSTGEAFTSLSATTDRTEFRITDGTKRHWTREQPPVVYVNSTAHTDFTYNPVQGKLSFVNALSTAESAQVTADVYWVTASYLPWTRTWSLDANVSLHDVTSFSTTVADASWRTFAPGLQGATVDLGRIVDTPTTETPMWFDRAITDTDVILELVINTAASTQKFEAYGRVETDGFSVPIDSLQEESITIQVDGALYAATTE